MKTRKKIGFGLMAFVFALVAFEKVMGMIISVSFVKMICGETYMIEPNKELAAQGMLTDTACGFDVDMQLVAFAVSMFLISAALILWPSLKKESEVQ